MDLSALQVNSAALIALSGTIIGFLAKLILDKILKESDDTKQEMKDLTKSLQEVTIAITELKIEMRHVKDSLYLIQKLKVDVDALGSKVRDMSKN